MWFLILSCVGLFAIPVSAAQFGYFTYEVTPSNTVTITRYTGSGGEVAIPGTIASNSVTSIGDWAFNRTGVTSVTIPSCVTTIDYMAFQCCSSLTNVTISGSVSNIGNGAFSYCTGLTSITIPDSVSGIGDSVFRGCSSMTEVVIPDSVRTIRNFAFSGCSSLTNATIGNGVTNIGNNAFSYCTGLTSVTIPGSVSSIGYGAFFDCTGLTNVTIPGSGVTSIGYGAFYDCTGLTSVIIGDGVTSIGGRAFFACSRLTNVSIPKSVTTIGDNAFGDCGSLASVTVAPSNPAYSSVDGILFNKAQTTLISYVAGRVGPYSIPDGVTSIGDEAFAYCSGLTSITIPDRVTSIGDYAFAACHKLRRVYCSGSAPTYGSHCFGDGYGPTVYYLPGTTGWGSTSADRPAVLWNPEFTAVDLKAGGISCTVTGTTDIPVALEVSTNLAAKQWTRLCTTNLSGGMSDLVDSAATNQPTRFYRIVGP